MMDRVKVYIYFMLKRLTTNEFESMIYKIIIPNLKFESKNIEDVFIFKYGIRKYLDG